MNANEIRIIRTSKGLVTIDIVDGDEGGKFSISLSQDDALKLCSTLSMVVDQWSNQGEVLLSDKSYLS